MAERALTEEAMLAGLHDIRLPGTAPGGLAAELLAAAGAGILAALLLAALVMLVTRARAALPAREAVVAGSEDVDDGSEAARRRALLRRLKRERPERFAALRGEIYRRDGLPALPDLEAMVKGP